MDNAVRSPPISKHLREFSAHGKVTVFIGRAKGKFAPGFFVITSPRFRNAEGNAVCIYPEVFLAIAIIGLYKRSLADEALSEDIYAPVLADDSAIPAGAGVTKFFLYSVFG